MELCVHDIMVVASSLISLEFFLLVFVFGFESLVPVIGGSAFILLSSICFMFKHGYRCVFAELGTGPLDFVNLCLRLPAS